MGGKAVPDFVRAQGQQVITKAEQFGQKTIVPDTAWLEWCGAEWVGITKDEAAARRVKVEMAAARRYKVRLFYFPNAQLRSDQYISHLERHWTKIMALAERPGPFVVAIYYDRLEEKD